MSIPICWKCASAIHEPDITGYSVKLIGCKDCKNIVDYGTAMRFCPLIKEKMNDYTNEK